MGRIGRNILSLGVSRIVSGLIIFIVYIRLVTYLGPDNFGRFSLIVAYYTIFSLFVDLGISRYVIKKVSENQEAAPLYLSNFLIAQIFLAILVFLSFIAVPQIADYEQAVSRPLLLAGLGLAIAALAIPFASLVQAWQKIHILATVNFLKTLVNAAWLALAVIFRQNLMFIFLVYILIGIMEVAIYFFITHKSFQFRFRPHWPLIKKMVFYGIPFAFISGFEVLIQKVDVVIQKHFLSFVLVGLYSSAYRFLDFLTFIPAVVGVSLFPFFASLGHLKTEETSQTISRLNRYMAMLAFPIAVGGTIFADKIVLTLFDERYLGAAPAFRVLIWATALTLVYAVPNIIMIVKRTRLTVAVLGLIALFNIVSNWLLIPRYGIIASAWITVASYFLTALSYWYYSRQISNFYFFRYLWWPIVCSVVMGVVAWEMRDRSIFLLVPVSAVVYFVALALVREIKMSDFLALKSIFFKTS